MSNTPTIRVVSSYVTVAFIPPVDDVPTYGPFAMGYINVFHTGAVATVDGGRLFVREVFHKGLQNVFLHGDCEAVSNSVTINELGTCSIFLTPLTVQHNRFSAFCETDSIPPINCTPTNALILSKIKRSELATTGTCSSHLAG